LLAINNEALLYINFLKLSQSFNDCAQYPSIDATEERLLDYLASIWYSGIKITVEDTAHAFADFSASTIYRRLKTLRNKGLINLDIDKVDNRIKYIVPTDLTDSYFSFLGQCVSQAIKS